MLVAKASKVIAKLFLYSFVVSHENGAQSDGFFYADIFSM